MRAVGLQILGQWAAERPDLDAAPMGIFGRLSRVERMLDRLIVEVSSRFGINRGEFDVSATLRRSGEPYSLMPTELFRSRMLSSAAMTNRIDRLEGRGLVRRSPDPEDRRGVRIKEREQLAGLLRKLLFSMEGDRDGAADFSGAREE